MKKGVVLLVLISLIFISISFVYADPVATCTSQSQTCVVLSEPYAYVSSCQNSGSGGWYCGGPSTFKLIPGSGAVSFEDCTSTSQACFTPMTAQYPIGKCTIVSSGANGPDYACVNFCAGKKQGTPCGGDNSDNYAAICENGKDSIINPSAIPKCDDGSYPIGSVYTLDSCGSGDCASKVSDFYSIPSSGFWIQDCPSNGRPVDFFKSGAVVGPQLRIDGQTITNIAVNTQLKLNDYCNNCGNALNPDLVPQTSPFNFRQYLAGAFTAGCDNGRTHLTECTAVSEYTPFAGCSGSFEVTPDTANANNDILKCSVTLGASVGGIAKNLIQSAKLRIGNQEVDASCNNDAVCNSNSILDPGTCDAYSGNPILEPNLFADNPYNCDNAYVLKSGIRNNCIWDSATDTCKMVNTPCSIGGGLTCTKSIALPLISWPGLGNKADCKMIGVTAIDGYFPLDNPFFVGTKDKTVDCPSKPGVRCVASCAGQNDGQACVDKNTKYGTCKTGNCATDCSQAGMTAQQCTSGSGTSGTCVFQRSTLHCVLPSECPPSQDCVAGFCGTYGCNAPCTLTVSANPNPSLNKIQDDQGPGNLGSILSCSSELTDTDNKRCTTNLNAGGNIYLKAVPANSFTFTPTLLTASDPPGTTGWLGCQQLSTDINRGANYDCVATCSNGEQINIQATFKPKDCAPCKTDSGQTYNNGYYYQGICIEDKDHDGFIAKGQNDAANPEKSCLGDCNDAAVDPRARDHCSQVVCCRRTSQTFDAFINHFDFTALNYVWRINSQCEKWGNGHFAFQVGTPIPGPVDVSYCAGKASWASSGVCNNPLVADCPVCTHPAANPSSNSRQCGVDALCEGVKLDAQGNFVQKSPAEMTIPGFTQMTDAAGRAVWAWNAADRVCGSDEQCVLYGAKEFNWRDPTKCDFLPGALTNAGAYSGKDAECGLLTGTSHPPKGFLEGFTTTYSYPNDAQNCLKDGAENLQISNRYGEFGLDGFNKFVDMKICGDAVSRGDLQWSYSCVKKDKCADGVSNSKPVDIFNVNYIKSWLQGIKLKIGGETIQSGGEFMVRLADMDHPDCHFTPYCTDDDGDGFCANSNIFPDVYDDKSLNKKFDSIFWQTPVIDHALPWQDKNGWYIVSQPCNSVDTNIREPAIAPTMKEFLKFTYGDENYIPPSTIHIQLDQYCWIQKDRKKIGPISLGAETTHPFMNWAIVLAKTGLYSNPNGGQQQFETTLSQICKTGIDTNDNKDGEAGYDLSLLMQSPRASPFDNNPETGVEKPGEGDYLCPGAWAAFKEQFSPSSLAQVGAGIVVLTVISHIPIVGPAIIAGLFTYQVVGQTSDLITSWVAGSDSFRGQLGAAGGQLTIMALTYGGYRAVKALEFKATLTNGAAIEKCPVKQAPVPACFLAGTQIMLENGTYKNIENIKIDDRVAAWDVENNISGNATVSETFVYNVTSYLKITYEVVNDSG